MDQKVFLDLDGVLANFVDAACKLHDKPYPYDDPNNFGNGNLEKIFGLDKATFVKGMDHLFWASLKKLPYADDVVNILTKAYGVGNICILTKPVETLGCVSGKIAWIHEHYPQFKYQHYIGPSKRFCANPNSILFDDYERNVNEFLLHGGHACLIPAPWNTRWMHDPVQSILDYIDS